MKGFKQIYRDKLRLFKQKRGKLEDVWDSLKHGVTIEDDDFLIQLDWQKRVVDSLLMECETFSNEKRARIFFLNGEFGSSKTQILRLLDEKMEKNVGAFTVYHSCGRGKTVESLLGSIKKRAEKKISYEYNDKRKKELGLVLQEDDVFNALERLVRIYPKGVYLFVDEFDVLVDDRAFPRWMDFLVTLNDEIKGVFTVLAVAPANLESIKSMDARTARFLGGDEDNIVYLEGRYGKEKIVEAVAHFAALYSAFKRDLKPSTIDFLEEAVKVVRESFGENKLIRQANRDIIMIIEKTALLEERGVIEEVINASKNFEYDKDAGNRYERGLQEIFSSTSWSFNMGQSSYRIIFDKERITYRKAGCETWISDGRFDVQKYSEIYRSIGLEFPVDIKLVGHTTGNLHDTDVEKIACNADLLKVYPIVFVGGYPNEKRIKRQFRDQQNWDLVTVVVMQGLPSLLPLSPKAKDHETATTMARILSTLYDWGAVKNSIEEKVRFYEEPEFKEMLRIMKRQAYMQPQPLSQPQAITYSSKDRHRQIARKIVAYFSKKKSSQAKPLSDYVQTISKEQAKAILEELEQRGLMEKRGKGWYRLKGVLKVDEVTQIVSKYV